MFSVSDIVNHFSKEAIAARLEKRKQEYIKKYGKGRWVLKRGIETLLGLLPLVLLVATGGFAVYGVYCAFS